MKYFTNKTVDTNTKIFNFVNNFYELKHFGMFRLLIGITISSIIFFSCKTLSPSQMFDINSDYSYSEFTLTPKDFIIKPYDKLEILLATNDGQTLLEQTFTTDPKGINQNQPPKENITYMVNEDSTVKIPTLGRYKLAGYTVRQAEDSLEAHFAKNFQNPFVKIKIVNRKVILFLDEGTNGKVISLPEESMTLLEAIASAGGLSKNSKAYKIRLIRGNNANPQIFNYNIRNLEEFRKADFNLVADDIIYVDSKPRYLSKIITEMQPYLVLITSAVLVYSIFSR